MNPITYARYLSSYSTSSLAKTLKVSRQYLSRLEQGLYDKPNDKLLNWARDTINKNLENPVTSEAIEQLYREWQWQKRESCKLDKVLRPFSVTKYDLVKQPDIIYYHKIFSQWVNDYWNSTHAFCVDMCLHPSPVVDYIDGKTHTMPNNLKKVMTQLNLVGEGFKTSER